MVIATYDRWPLVAEAVGSVLAQDVEGVELVVVDDGSSDGTPGLLRDRFPGLHVVERPNAERGAARNAGAAVAVGRYLTFLDSDDVYEPAHLAGVVAAVADDPAAVATRAAYWDPGTGAVRPIPLRWPWWELRRAALFGMVVPLQGLVVRRDVFDAVGRFPEDRAVAGSEDWVLLARITRRHDVRLVPATSVRLRAHAGRSMNDPDRIIASRRAGERLVLDEGGLGLDDAEREVVRAGTARFAAAHLYEAGRTAEARRELRRLTSLGLPLAGRLGGRLWLQSLLGPAVSRWARTAKVEASGCRARLLAARGSR